MKLGKLIENVTIKELHASLELEIGDISFDSRQTRKGDLFVAVPGLESDGYDYINAAVDQGAGAVICEKAPGIQVPYLLVEDSRLALALICVNWFGNPGKDLRLIGVTGTNGKTTATMLIKHMIEIHEGAKVGLVGTNQNMIGYRELPAERTTPEPYALQKLLREMADEGCEYAVLEVSSHGLALDRVAGLEFEIGVFTNLTQDHLDFHRDMEDYAAAKAKLFRHCKKAAINMDDACAGRMLEGADCEVIRYSIDQNEAELVAKDLRLEPTRVKFCALTPGVLERVTLPIPGRFSVYNALAVIACGLHLGYTCGEAALTLETAKGVKGRLEVVPTQGDFTILIDYAHTPDALRNVLSSMKEVTAGRVVALFGCGGDRDKTKRPQMGAIAAQNADFVIVTSDNPRTEPPLGIIEDILKGMEETKTPCTVIENRREAIAFAIDNHQPGDMIILAGKGHETYQIIGKEKFHLDEREIVAEHLKK